MQGPLLHTIVRGRFVMRDGRLVTEAAGWGRSVKRIQRRPMPQPQRAEDHLPAVLQTPEGVRKSACRCTTMAARRHDRQFG